MNPLCCSRSPAVMKQRSVSFFEKYWDLIYSTAYTFTKSTEQSRDLGQEIFARLWVHRHKLEAVHNFEAYLFTMARNVALNSFREKVYVSANDQFFEQYFMGIHSRTPTDEIDLKELKELVEQGINQLPSQQQRAFRLSRFQGMSIELIAQEMGLSYETAKSHLVRATARLRQYLKDHKDTGVIIFILLFL